MDIKPYIAIFFTVIFLGKFLMMDAKFLEDILDNEVTYVNPFCEKNKVEDNRSGIIQDLLPTSKTQNIAIDSFCNTPFQFEIITWRHMNVEGIYQPYFYTSSILPQIFPDSCYPPPKYV